MTKFNEKNIILDNTDIENKIQRIGLEILEDNIDKSKIIFFGISTNGEIIAKKIIDNFNKISKIKTDIFKVIIINDGSNNIIKYDRKFDAESESLIIVSDVSQSGKTIQLVTSDLMKHNPSKIKTAVIINRDHSLFPIKINFSGLNLSTSVNEHVDVVVNKQKELTVYLN